MGDILVIFILSILSGMAIVYLKENKDSCGGDCASCGSTCPLTEDLKKARKDLKNKKR